MHDYFKTHGFAVEVDMCDKTNDNQPTMTGFMVPREQANKGEFGDKMLIARIEFGRGEDEENGFTLYRPDGSAFNDDAHPLPANDVDINTPLNEAWTGDPDSPMMERIRDCIIQTIVMMVSANELHKQAGVPLAHSFNTLVNRLGNAKGFVRDNDTGEMSPLTEFVAGAEEVNNEG